MQRKVVVVMARNERAIYDLIVREDEKFTDFRKH